MLSSAEYAVPLLHCPSVWCELQARGKTLPVTGCDNGMLQQVSELCEPCESLPLADMHLQGKQHCVVGPQIDEECDDDATSITSHGLQPEPEGVRCILKL